MTSSKFNAWFAAEVMGYVESHGGSRKDMRLISWPGQDDLYRMNLLVVEREAPEERCIEYDEYAKKIGDLAAHGRGGKIVAGPQQQKLPQLRQAAAWVNRKKLINAFQKQQRMHDSSDDLAGGQLNFQIA